MGLATLLDVTELAQSPMSREDVTLALLAEKVERLEMLLDDIEGREARRGRCTHEHVLKTGDCGQFRLVRPIQSIGSPFDTGT